MGDNMPKNDNTDDTMTTNRANHQNSLRRARPLKSKYFVKHVFTAVTGSIIGLADTWG